MIERLLTQKNYTNNILQIGNIHTFLGFFALVFLTLNVNGQSLVINEFCSLNTTIFDDDNDTPDWLEIYNPSGDTVNLSNYFLSDEAESLGRWNFPAVELEPEMYMLVFASGKNKTEQSYLTNLINMGDTFAFAIGSEDIAADWKQPSFNDGAWETGASGFGYGDNDDVTIIEDGTISVFVRKMFQINDTDAITKLYLHMDYDDGFVAYINGVEVARTNLGTPGTEVPYDQEAEVYVEPLIVNDFAPELFEIEVTDGLLSEGDNVLAIQIHNNSPTSSDLTLIPFLSVESKKPVAGNSMPRILGMASRSLHTNFKISADGEVVYLSDASGNVIDKTDSIVLPPGVSYGRSVENINNWVFYKNTTPGGKNSTEGYKYLGNSIVSFAPIGGKYGSSKEVRLSSYAGGAIHYTTDGSTPTNKSPKYNEPIDIEETTVIKAIVFSDDVLPLNPSIETYILENRNFDLPIISISSEPEHFFDWNTGILVDGPNAESRFPHFGANFWQDWERPIYIEYYNKSGEKQFEAPGGVKIFGGWSRGMQQKSMSLFARKAYGVKTFDYKFFEERNNDKFKSLVLRNSGNDSDRSHFRDGLMTGLVRDVDIDRQAFQPSVVYINGKYWGILNMREKVNEDFLAQNHKGVSADKVDLLVNDGMEVSEGSNEQYFDMINYIEDYGVSNDEDFDYVAGLMDLDNFMDYQIAQIYYDNQDWPGNNIKFWRPQRENGKWRWILYDTDFGYGIGFGAWGSGYDMNTLDFALYPSGSGWPNPSWSTFLLRSFVENDQFVKDFANRFADRLNYDFEPNRVIDFIDEIVDDLEGEVPYHRNRWGELVRFDDEVDGFYEFAQRRPFYMRQFLRDRFNLGNIVNIEVEVNDEKQGKVQVNTLKLDEYPWKGKYFENNSVPIAAIAEPGYQFSHWEGVDANSSYLDLNIPTEGIKLKAVFKESSKDYNSVVINEIKYKSSEEENSGDWLELFNTTKVPLDISGWKLTDTDVNNAFEFPKGSVIAPKGYLVVCEELKNIAKQNPDVKNVVGNFKFGLSSSYDMLWLVDNNNVTIDSLHYFNEAPWPTVSENQSISLNTPYSDNALGANWLSSLMEGTPGENNDYFTGVKKEQVVVKESLISLYPNPVIDYVTVGIKNSKSQNISVDLHDIKGCVVTNLYEGDVLSGTKALNVNLGDEIPSGIYVVKVKFESGEQQSVKLVKM